MAYRLVPALLLGASFALPGLAQAQDQDIAATTADPMIAEQCMEDLQAFRVQAQEDGYWLAGWGTRWGWGYGTAQAPTRGVAPPETTTEAPAAPGEPPATDAWDSPWEMRGPWGAAGVPAVGVMSPRHQMRALYSAALVFAHRGNEEACQNVLAETRDIYADTISTLEEAGVRPEEIMTWRQEQILASRSVMDLPYSLSSAQIVGADVRNARDEHLGSIEDAVFDRETGDIDYVVISRGGFFGIGEDEIAVPWEMLEVAPGMNLFVLNVAESVIENAPEIDADDLSAPGAYEEYRERVDSYWEQHAPA